jgi:hypothetical protein
MGAVLEKAETLGFHTLHSGGVKGVHEQAVGLIRAS